MSHNLFPDLTERMSANIAHSEVGKAPPVPQTTGAIHAPMTDGLKVEGGVRERMHREDEARRH